MTLASTKSSITLIGNGVTKTWDFDFTVWAESQAAVWLADPDGLATEITSNFTVTLNADQAVNPGGTVTYPVTGSAIATGYSLVILRDMGFTQQVDLQKNQGFNPEVLEVALDQATAERQQLKEAISRMITAGPGQSPEDFLVDMVAFRDAASGSATASENSRQAAETAETAAAAAAASAAASAASVEPVPDQIHAAASKATPVDADELGLADSAETFGLKKLTWANLKATLLSQLKDATGGLVGMTLFKINFKNAANTFTSFFTNVNTAARTYTFQDRNGTIADDTDLALKLAFADTRFKIGTTTRSTDTASSSVAITGLGFTPKAVFFFAGRDSGTARDGSFGFSTGNAQSRCLYLDSGVAGNLMWNGGIVAGVYDNSAAYVQASMTSLDADGFTLLWAKTGTLASRTLTLGYLAFR